MFVYSDKSELEKIVFDRVNDAEARAKKRLLSSTDLNKMIESISSTPYGLVQGDGGHVGSAYRYVAETTYVRAGWYTQGKMKYISLHIYRGRANYGNESSSIDICNDKWKAFSYVFPERAHKIKAWLEARKIRRDLEGLSLLPNNWSVTKTYRDGDICLAHVLSEKDYIFVVVTPAGWVDISHCTHKNTNRSPWLHLKDLGFPIPHRKKDRVWNEDLDAHMVMYLLSQ